MAVPVEMLKGRLKAYLTTKAINNLSNVRIDEFSARLCSLPEDGADDAAIDAVISNADAIFPFKDLASNDDRVRTLEAQTKKPETKTKEQLDAEEKAKADADAIEKAKSEGQPEWVKALMTKLDSQEQTISALVAGKTQETKASQAKAAFEKSEKFKNLPEVVKNGLFERIKLDSETPFEDQITGLETEHDAYTQFLANSTGHSGQPGGTGGTAKLNDALLDSVVDSF